jgi:peroxiredoxin Q/BCP
MSKTKAFDFLLEDHEGKRHSLKSIKSKYVVLYFYPKDSTPGCTLEALEFSQLLSQFKKLGARVVGISGGDNRSKEKFCKKHKLSVLLLSDRDFAVAKAYGAYGPKTFMGRKFQGIYRNTYLIDKSRKIVGVFESVKVAGHAATVLDHLASLVRPTRSEDGEVL